MGLLKFSPTGEAISALCNPQTRDIVKEPVAEGTLPGLANLGNTCFANSVLQCLLNTPGWFPEACLAFSQFEVSTHSNKAALGRSFQRLALEYGSTANGALLRSNSALNNMKEAIGAIDPKFAGCQQQDAYEFLGCLLEGLEGGFGALFRGVGEDKSSPSADIIRAICGVKMHTRRSCHGCAECFEVDHVTDTSLRLPLLSPAAQFDASLREEEEQMPISLQELLEIARRPEVIEGYDCDVCRARTLAKEVEYNRPSITQHAGVISATSDVLVVVLYRFGHALDAQGNFSATKVKRQVSCPTELAMETGRYRLFGVVSHLGSSLSSGHYVAAVRSRRDDMWYECNDDRVTPLNLTALYDGRAVTSVRADAEPYILFYHRESADNEARGAALAVVPATVGAESTQVSTTNFAMVGAISADRGEVSAEARFGEGSKQGIVEDAANAGGAADKRETKAALIELAVASNSTTAASATTTEDDAMVTTVVDTAEENEVATRDHVDESEIEDNSNDIDMSSSAPVYPELADKVEDMEVDVDLSEWVIVPAAAASATAVHVAASSEEQPCGSASAMLAVDSVVASADATEISTQRRVRRRVEKACHGCPLSSKSLDRQGGALPLSSTGSNSPMLSQVGQVVELFCSPAKTISKVLALSPQV